MAGSEVAERDESAPQKISPEVAQRVMALCDGIPVDDGSGAENIVTQLLDAATVDQLNEPWDATSGKRLAGKRLAISGITRRPSQFEDGTGIFLVVDAADASSGEKCVFTTSALAVVVQLAQCHVKKLFPVIAEVVVAERPTERGFYPYHLKILAAGNRERS